MQKIAFEEIDFTVPRVPGIYEIHMHTGVPLKVGISVDIRVRLQQHRDSRDSGLKLEDGGNWANPDDVTSIKSILAKHLYFDRSITKDYDLATQDGRKRFLMNECFILFEITASKAAARELERQLERTKGYRYRGRVQCR